MYTKMSAKRIVSYSILALFALICVLMLCFSTMYASKEVSQTLYPDADNDFVWMSFESNIAYGKDWESFAVLLGVISIFQLIYGIVAVILVVVNFLTHKSAKKNTGIIIVGFVSMLLYAIEGIVYEKVYCDIMDYKSKYFSTAAYIPLIIGIVLVIGFVLIEKYWVEKQSDTDNVIVTKASRIVSPKDESDIINNLSQYKDLLDNGIISQEEFDAKKKQLLDL